MQLADQPTGCRKLPLELCRHGRDRQKLLAMLVDTLVWWWEHATAFQETASSMLAVSWNAVACSHHQTSASTPDGAGAAMNPSKSQSAAGTGVTAVVARNFNDADRLSVLVCLAGGDALPSASPSSVSAGSDAMASESTHTRDHTLRFVATQEITRTASSPDLRPSPSRTGVKQSSACSGKCALCIVCVLPGLKVYHDRRMHEYMRAVWCS